MKNKNMKFEVTIVGGGVAGVVAAIAASRNGSKTLLINNAPVLGGNSSSEIRVWTRGSSGGGNIFSEEMGILGELKLRNNYINESLSPIIWDEVLLEAVIKEKNITLLLNTLVVDCKYENQEVKSLIAFSTRGEVKYYIESDYFIDASGDGFLAANTDIDYVIGKESRDKYSEELAPINPSSCTQGSSILFFTEKKDHKVTFIPPSFAYSTTEIDKLINNDGRIVNEKTNGLDFWWVEYGGTSNMFEDLNDVSFELKKLSYGIFNYIKNSGLYDADNLDLTWIGNIPGKRESRRFITDTVLTYNDIKDKKTFEDVAFYGGWFLDFHPEGGIYSTQESCTQIPVGIFPIPLSSLYSSKVKNLLLCGRIIGTTHSSFSSTRVMDTCALSGQAAGTAAAYLNKSKKSTKDLKDDYNLVQENLEDIILINKELNYKNNITKLEVNSTMNKVEGRENGYLSCLDTGVFVTIPNNAISKNTSIVIDSKEICELEVRERCDILPHRFDIGYSNKLIYKLNKGRNIVNLSRFKKSFDTYLTLSFKADNNVSFPTLDESIPGILMGNISKPKYFNPYIILDDFTYLFKENLINGYNRPYNNYNAWVSEKIECEINLEANNFNLLKLYFDPNLERELVSSRQLKVNESHMVDDVFGVAPSLVKDFEIIPYKNNKKLETIEIKDNYKRLVKVKFTEEIDSLTIKFKDTWGDKRIRLFSIEIDKK